MVVRLTSGRVENSKELSDILRSFDTFATEHLERINSWSQVAEYENRIATKAASIIEDFKAGRKGKRLTGQEIELLDNVATILSGRRLYFGIQAGHRASALGQLAVKPDPLQKPDRADLHLSREQAKIIGRNIIDVFVPRCKWTVHGLVEAARPYDGPGVDSVYRWRAGKQVPRFGNVEPIATAIGKKLGCEMSLQDLLAENLESVNPARETL